MSRTTIVLELTKSEAETLMRLTGRAVSWFHSGQFGKNAREIYATLNSLGVDEASYMPLRGGAYQNWKPGD